MQKIGQTAAYILCCVFAVSKHDKVIRVANEWNAKHFKVPVQGVEIDICEEGRERLALWDSDLVGKHLAELRNIDR